MYTIDTLEIEAMLATRFKPNLAYSYAEILAHSLGKASAWVKISPEEASRSMTTYWLEGEHIYNLPSGKFKSKKLLNGGILFFKWESSNNGFPVRGWPSRVMFHLRKNYPITDEDGLFIITVLKSIISRDWVNYREAQDRFITEYSRASLDDALHRAFNESPVTRAF